MGTTAKLRRAVQSISVALVISLVVLVYNASQAPRSSWYFYFLNFIILLLVLLIIGQTYLEFKRRTYDPSLVLKFQEKFDGLERQRAQAAKAILTNSDLVAIEDVLDFFEELGLYLTTEQISIELIHHYFYHWIRLYLDSEPVQRYVSSERAEEPARWEHLNRLLSEVSKIELPKQRVRDVAELRFSELKLKRYLAEEQALLEE